MLPYESKAFQNRSQQASKKDGWILKASFGQKCVDFGGLCPLVRFICCHLCIPLVRFISCPPARFICCHLFASSVVWKIDRNFQSTSRRGKRLFISVDGCCLFFQRCDFGFRCMDLGGLCPPVHFICCQCRSQLSSIQ